MYLDYIKYKTLIIFVKDTQNISNELFKRIVSVLIS